MEKPPKKEEFTLYTAEDLGKKAKSKINLYFIFTNEFHCALPPFRECSIQFLKGILSDYNKIDDAVKFHIPSYSELSAKKVCPLIQKDEKLIKFQNTNHSRFQTKTIFYNTLELETNGIKSAAKDCEKKSIYEDHLEGNYIRISNKCLEEIQNVANPPNKINKIIVYQRKEDHINCCKRRLRQII